MKHRIKFKILISSLLSAIVFYLLSYMLLFEMERTSLTNSGAKFRPIYKSYFAESSPWLEGIYYPLRVIDPRSDDWVYGEEPPRWLTE